MRLAPALAALALIAAAPGAQAATPRADLRVSSVSAGAGTAQAGATLKVGDTTRNAGRGSARRSTTAYFLSSDRRKSKADFKSRVARSRRCAPEGAPVAPRPAESRARFRRATGS